MASSGSDDKEECIEDGNENCAEESEVVLDLSGRRLKKLERAPVNQTFATALVLDNNALQNLSNLDSYGELERLSIANNQVIRMYWFARMYSLRILNLPNNAIVQIEGLRELHHLIHLNLSGNNIKAIEGVSHSLKLEHLNLSGNFVTQLTDLSMLKNIKELFLHRNHIGSLQKGNKYLPPSLFILTLSDNNIGDLNELYHLSHLNNLEQFTILNNPCLDPVQQLDESGEQIGPPLDFDNRPYVINWCLNLKVLDGYKVTPKESLKAEWLYSQGKGRCFQIGEHFALVQYLSSVCLAGGGWGGADLPDDDDKLAKILQLAKQHQHELRHSAVNGMETSESVSGGRSSSHDSPSSQRRMANRTASLRRNTAPPRASAKASLEGHRRSNSHNPSTNVATTNSAVKKQQELNCHSYHVELSSTLYGGDLKTPDTPSLMTQSMDPSLLSQLSNDSNPNNIILQPHRAINRQMNIMSQSLGPEHMSLTADQMMNSYSMGGGLSDEAKPSSTRKAPMNLMSQSMGPDELKMSLSGGNEYNLNGDARPNKMYSDQTSNSMSEKMGSALEGSTQFVPAPESIMSPEFQSAVSLQSTKKTTSRNSVSSSVPANKASSRSAAQRPKGTPMKNSTPDPRGSPRSHHRVTQQSTPPPGGAANTSPKLKHSPKPAPRASRNSSSKTTTNIKMERSPTTPKGLSEGESDNTDSEISVSKLQTIKSIAAERKGRERRSASSSHRSEASHHSNSNSTHRYEPERYKSNSQNNKNQSKPRSMANGGSSSSERRGTYTKKPKMNEVQAIVTIQRYWRGFYVRSRNQKVSSIREDIRHSRAEKHIRYLTDKLRAAEAGLEKERRLRHLQLDAIRTLWREIQKLQVSRGAKEGNTPSTPMTPLTPLTPLENARKVGVSKNSKIYSEESVKELTDFCSSLQTQVTDLHDSLSTVTQVMNAFCNLPGSQSLLTMSNSSGGGSSKDASIPLSQSVKTFTNSIVALTSSIQSENKKENGKGGNNVKNTEESTVVGVPGAPHPSLVASVTSVTSNDLSSTGQDVSTLSIDDSTGDTNREMQESPDSSQSSISASLSGGQAKNEISPPPKNEGGQSSSAKAPPPPSSGGVKRPPQVHTGPQRPSSLPVARPHTPRSNS